MCDGGATTQRTHLLCNTLLWPVDDVSSATELPLTVVLSPCSSLMDWSSHSQFEEVNENSCEPQRDTLQTISDRRSDTKGRPPLTFMHPVPAHSFTATDKRDVSSAATRARAQLANDSSMTSDSPSRMQPGLINACSRSRAALKRCPTSFPHNATFAKCTSAQHTIAAAAAPPPMQAAAARQHQQMQALASPVVGPTSLLTSAVATTTPEKPSNQKNGDATGVKSGRHRFSASTAPSSAAVPAAASKGLARHTLRNTPPRYDAGTPKAHGDSHAALESPRDRVVVAGFNNANECAECSCADIDRRYQTQERMEVAKANSLQWQQQQADAALQLPVKGSGSATNATRSSPQHARRGESTSSEARQGIGGCNRGYTSKPVEEANHRHVSMGTIPAHANAASVLPGPSGAADDRIATACNHTSVSPVLAQEDSSAGGGGACAALPPQEGASLAPVDGNAMGLAAMEDGDVGDTRRNLFVAVRVRPCTPLLIANGASSAALTDVAECKPQRELRDSNSAASHSATMSGRQSAGKRAMRRAAEDNFGGSDGNGYASKGSCVSVDPTNGFIDCSVAVGASTSATSAVNSGAAEQWIRTFRFHFDHILDDRVAQADVMARVGQRAVARVLQGCHGTVMCYGQTGSGKTFTIAGPHGGKLSRKTLQLLASRSAPAEAAEHVGANVGLLPRMLLLLFQGLEAQDGASATAAISSEGEDVEGRSSSTREQQQQQPSAAPVSSWRVMLSAMELYNDDLRDLLPGDVSERVGTKPDKRDAPHLLTAVHRHHLHRPLTCSNICNRHHRGETVMAAPSPHDGAEAVPGSSLSRTPQQLIVRALPGEPTSEDSPDMLDTASSSEGSDNDDRHAASRPTPNGLDGDSATASTVQRGRGQSSVSPPPSAAPLRARASQRGNSAAGQNPKAAASGVSTTSNARVVGAIGSTKRTPTRWAAPTTAPVAVPLQIRQGAPASSASLSEHVCIEGLREHQVHNLHDAMEVVRLALKQRQTGNTKRNADSSRSHAFFFVHVEQRQRRSRDREKPDWDHIRRSTLMLVDLAGSERISHTGARGLQLKEARSINLSLSALGNAMRLLSSASRASLSQDLASTSHSGDAARKGVTGVDTHIPYRDSKLTRILQNSLSGKAITFLLCNVSPDPRDAAETMSTLRFAKLCKSVKHKAIVNKATAGTTDARSAEQRAILTAVAEAEAKIRQLVGNTSALQNRLRQLATYTWWLEGHLGYFAATMIQQQQRRRRSSALATNAVVGAVISPTHPHGNGGGDGLVLHEKSTAPKLMSTNSSPGVGAGGAQSCSRLAPFSDRERGVKDERAAPDAAHAGPALPEWWFLSPRPSSLAAQADGVGDGDGASEEAEAYWHSTAVRAFLSPAYLITQRRTELERKLLAAAAATDALHRGSAVSTAGNSTSSKGSIVPASDRSPANISVGIDSTPKKVRVPDGNPRRPQAEHEPALLQPSPRMATLPSVPRPTFDTRGRQPRRDPPASDTPTDSAEEQTARAALQTRLAVAEQSNLLLRMRLAELHCLLRKEGGAGHVAQVHQENAEHATRRIVAKEASVALFEQAPAASASSASAPKSTPPLTAAHASLVPWPPHYSRVSHDASLEVFLARCGFAAMGPMSPKPPA